MCLLPRPFRSHKRDRAIRKNTNIASFHLNSNASLVAPIVIVTITIVIGGLKFLEPIDNYLLDTKFHVLRLLMPQPAKQEVVIVGIDDETARRFPEPVSLWHGHISQFLTVMAAAKPRIVGIDIVLPDRSFEAVLPGSDKRLLKSMLEARKAYPFVVALTVDQTGKPRPIHLPYLAIAGEQGSGYALFPSDRDGRVRRFDERLGAKGEQVTTLVGQMARRLGLEPRAGWIDYWTGAPFEYVPLHRVLEWAQQGDHQALARRFSGKPVLLGMVLPFTDRQSVPVPLASWEAAMPDMPGVVLHAQALRAMLGSGLIQSAPKAVIFAAVAITALLWFVVGSGTAALIIFCVVTAVLSIAAFWLITHGLFFPIAAPLLSASLALGGRSTLETVTRLRERRRLRRSFSGYVSPAVMHEILSGRVQPELGGASKFVCVMFSDIRGYTTRSEHMTPQEVIRFLNRYFEGAVRLIHARGGSVMSFMGDGIMVVFGAPKPLENPCQSAFDAARAMLEYVAALNERFQAEGDAPVEVGFGLHAGDAVIGHVGSSARHDYSAIGDVPNVASRLEGLTRESGYPILASRAVADQLAERSDLSSLGQVPIKGHTPVEVFGYSRTEVRSS